LYSGTPAGGGGVVGAIAPPEIFRVTYKIGSFLHKSDLGV